MAVMLMILIAIGCSSDENSKLAQMAADYADRQTTQSQRVLEIQKELATGSRNLVEADALARKEMAVIQRAFQTERLQLAQSYDQLELERRSIAAERNRAPIVAASITNIGMIFVCLLPLLLCLMLIYRKSVDDEQGLIIEFMLANIRAIAFAAVRYNYCIGLIQVKRASGSCLWVF